jgi:hypothetical protein
MLRATFIAGTAQSNGDSIPFRQSEGFTTASRFLWIGLIENFALILVIAAVIALVWS